MRLQTGNPGIGLRGEIFRQCATLATLELGGQFRVGGAIAIEQAIPRGLALGTGRLRVPGGINMFGNLEGGMVPAEAGARRGDFILAESCAVRGFLALLVRRSKADDGPGADQGRLARLRGRCLDRRLDRAGIMAIDIADHVPAVRLESGRRVIGEPAFDFAIDGDSVVVPDGDELAKAEGAGQRGDLVRNAFHQATVAEEDIGAVIDNVEIAAIEARGKHLFGKGHADGVGQALAERPGGGLDAGSLRVFGVTGSL